MPLFEAIYNDDLHFVRDYIHKGGDLNVTDEMGSTPLHVAIYQGDKQLIRLLLEHGADVNLLDEYGNSPLHVACIFGQKAAAELLIQYGAEIDSTSDQRTWTPLMVAINKSYQDIAEWLIHQGANPNHVDPQQGWTPVLVACDSGQTELTLRLIERGGKVDAVVTGGDARGRSAIHLASYYGDVALVRELLRQGADINQLPSGGGLSALHWAVYNQHLDLLQFLVEEGADVNLAASGIYQGRTPLHYAICAHSLFMTDLLLKAKADPLQKDTEGRSPLDIVLSHYLETERPVHQELINLLESYI